MKIYTYYVFYTLENASSNGLNCLAFFLAKLYGSPVYGEISLSVLFLSTTPSGP